MRSVITITITLHCHDGLDLAHVSPTHPYTHIFKHGHLAAVV